MTDKYKLKRAYGLECLLFDASKKVIECEYVGDKPDLDDNISIIDLDWILKALSMQQGNVYFRDVARLCTGINEIKQHYLIMKLAGINE